MCSNVQYRVFYNCLSPLRHVTYTVLLNWIKWKKYFHIRSKQTICYFTYFWTLKGSQVFNFFLFHKVLPCIKFWHLNHFFWESKSNTFLKILCLSSHLHILMQWFEKFYELFLFMGALLNLWNTIFRVRVHKH